MFSDPINRLLPKACITSLIVATTLSGFGQSKLVDENATAETKALFKNLAKLSEKQILFGHQHATEYGHGWNGDKDRSDVKSVTGSHPAVIGVDLLGFTGRSEEEIKKAKDDLRKNVADTYENELIIQLRVMTNLIEPAMIIVMALGVGFLLLSVLSAVFALTANIAR